MGLAHNIQPGERLLLVAPVFHVAALNAGAFPCLAPGGCLYIQTDFRPDEVVRALSEENLGMAISGPGHDPGLPHYRARCCPAPV